MHINGTAFAVERIAPDLVQQLVAGNDDTRIVQQQAEQFEFFQGQVHRLPCRLYHVANRVHPQFSQLEHLALCGLFRCPAEHCLNPCHQCHHAERLCHIVVCPVVQSHYLIVLRPLGSQHNDRQAFGFLPAADFPEDLQTVFFRQHNIQQHQFRQLFFHGVPELRGQPEPLCVHAGAPQGVDHQFPNAVVVFY